MKFTLYMGAIGPFSKLSFLASHLELLVQPSFHPGPRKSWRGSDQFSTSPTDVEAVKILFDACDGNLYFHGKNEMVLSFNDRKRRLWQGPQIQLVEEKFPGKQIDASPCG